MPDSHLILFASTVEAQARNPIPDDPVKIGATTVQAACRIISETVKIGATTVQVMVRADHKEIGGRYTLEETPDAEETDVIYHDLIFPRCISYGSTGSPNYVTDKVEVDSGSEQRNQRRAYPRHVYNINMENLGADEISEIMNLWHVCAGDFIGFLFLDPMDHTSANTEASLSDEATQSTDQLVASAIGSKSEYELFKYYAAGLRQRKRRIRYPDKDTLEVAVNGFDVENFEFDYDAGVLRFLKPIAVATPTMLSRAANGDITGMDFSALSYGDLIYMTGWSNPAYNAAPGGNPARVIFASNTTLRVQKFDGSAYGGNVLGPSSVSVVSALPPTGAEITAGFFFYVPVRFDEGDNMQGEIKAGLQASAVADFTNITLREVFE